MNKIIRKRGKGSSVNVGPRYTDEVRDEFRRSCSTGRGRPPNPEWDCREAHISSKPSLQGVSTP